MTKIIRTFHINAEPTNVLEYITAVHHHPAFISALKSVENVTGDPHEVGTEWDWSFIMAGIELHGKARTAQYEPSKIYSFKTFDGTDSTFVYQVDSENNGTLLTITVEYEMPQTILGTLANMSIAEAYNEAEADRAGENLKAILED